MDWPQFVMGGVLLGLNVAVNSHAVDDEPRDRVAIGVCWAALTGAVWYTLHRGGFW